MGGREVLRGLGAGCLALHAAGLTDSWLWTHHYTHTHTHTHTHTQTHTHIHTYTHAVSAPQELRLLLPPAALSAATGLHYALTDGLMGPEGNSAGGGGGDAGCLPAAGVVAALGLSVFGARHAVAALQALLGAGAGGAATTRAATAAATAAAAATAGRDAAWRWRLLAALEELLEQAEVRLCAWSCRVAAAATPAAA